LAFFYTGIKIKMKSRRRQNKTGQLPIQQFDEMFKDKNDIPYCVEVLRSVIPAVVNASEEYLHKTKKGPIVAWRNVLFLCGYIHYVNDQTAAEILNRKFKNLNIKEESFRTVQSRVYEEYQMQFQYILPPKGIQFGGRSNYHGRLASFTKREIS
jgi:hypothetical protein